MLNGIWDVCGWGWGTEKMEMEGKTKKGVASKKG